MDEADCQELLEDFNYGQRCLLRGLVKAAKAETPGADDDSYSSGIKRSGEAVSKAKSLRRTLGKLFNKPGMADDQPGPSFQRSDFPSSKKRPFAAAEDDDDFQPSRPVHSKGKYGPIGKTAKRKIKEIRLKVVGLDEYRTNTPTGSERNAFTRTIWVRETGTADDVEAKIKANFGWRHDCAIQFMYASGRHLRKATLDDIENATSWDVSTVRALMGNGCLYVVKISPETSLCVLTSSDSDDAGVSRTYLCHQF